MDTPYSDQFLAEIRGKLETQRRELVSRGRQALGEMRENNQYQQAVGDSIDDSTTEQGQSIMLRLKDREKSLLYKIDAAIERLEHEEYGECEVCGEPIGEKRLLARPVTTMCIDCKEQEEQREKRNRVSPGVLEEF